MVNEFNDHFIDFYYASTYFLFDAKGFKLSTIFISARTFSDGVLQSKPLPPLVRIQTEPNDSPR